MQTNITNQLAIATAAYKLVAYHASAFIWVFSCFVLCMIRLAVVFLKFKFGQVRNAALDLEHQFSLFVLQRNLDFSMQIFALLIFLI